MWSSVTSPRGTPGSPQGTEALYSYELYCSVPVLLSMQENLHCYCSLLY